MKPTKFAFIVFAVVSLFGFTGSAIFAQSQEVALPSAGLTPESPFYFLDKLGEALQRFFTFNPASKARLEIAFAAERIAEIKVVLSTKGVQAKGLAVAEAMLQDNLNRATETVVREKAKGSDVSQLISTLDDEVSQHKELLKEVFREQKQTLKDKEEQLKAALREAKNSGDTAKVELLSKELQDLKLQKKALDEKEDESEDAIEAENEKLENQLEAKDEALRKIQKAEKEKAEIISEYQEKGIDIPAGAFNKFDDLLSKSKAAFDAGNYEEAKQLAKQAKDSLEDVDETLDELEEIEYEKAELDEEIEDQQKETEEELKEADKEEAEQIKEEKNQDEERIKEEQKQVEEKQSDAEEKLREASKKEND